MMHLLQDATVWVLISFTIFAVLAFRAGKGKVLAKLDGRIAQIRKEIETARALRDEAQNLLAQYETKKRDAAKEAQALVEHARQSAAKITADAAADLAEITKRREQQLEDRLRRMEQNVMQEIRAHAAALAVKATAEIIASQMDEAANNRLVDESIRQVAGRLK